MTSDHVEIFLRIVIPSWSSWHRRLYFSHFSTPCPWTSTWRWCVLWTAVFCVQCFYVVFFCSGEWLIRRLPRLHRASYWSDCPSHARQHVQARARNPSIRNPTSNEIVPDSVVLWDTDVCFLHIQLIGTNVRRPKMHETLPEIDFESSRSPAK